MRINAIATPITGRKEIVERAVTVLALDSIARVD
jgi:hypothetical protein